MINRISLLVLLVNIVVTKVVYNDNGITGQTLPPEIADNGNGITGQTLTPEINDNDNRITEQTLSRELADKGITEQTLSPEEADNDNGITEQTLSREIADNNDGIIEQKRSQEVTDNDNGSTEQTLSPEIAANDNGITDQTPSLEIADEDNGNTRQTQSPEVADNDNGITMQTQPPEIADNDNRIKDEIIPSEVTDNDIGITKQRLSPEIADNDNGITKQTQPQEIADNENCVTEQTLSSMKANEDNIITKQTQQPEVADNGNGITKQTLSTERTNNDNNITKQKQQPEVSDNDNGITKQTQQPEVSDNDNGIAKHIQPPKIADTDNGITKQTLLTEINDNDNGNIEQTPSPEVADNDNVMTKQIQPREIVDEDNSITKQTLSPEVAYDDNGITGQTLLPEIAYGDHCITGQTPSPKIAKSDNGITKQLPSREIAEKDNSITKHPLSPETAGNGIKEQIPTSETADNESEFTEQSPTQEKADSDSVKNQYHQTKEIANINMEPYLQLQSTKEFIASFSGSLQKMIIEAQLRYCPVNTFCTHTVNSTYINDTDLCPRCQCQRACKSTDKCCPDFLLKEPDWEPLPYLCRPYEFSAYASFGKNAYFVSKCPTTYSREKRDFCERSLYSRRLKLSDMTPVHVSGSIPKVFKNQYCAFCNNRHPNEIHYHMMDISCSYAEGDEFMSHDDFLDLDMFTYKCFYNYSIKFKKGAAIFCESSFLISECNVTGKLKAADYDPQIERACLAYTSVYFLSLEKRYKNVFCAMCNSENPVVYSKLNSNKDILNAISREFGVRYVLSDSGVNTGFANFWTIPVTCPGNEHWAGCIPFICSFGRTPIERICVHDESVQVSNIYYLLHLKLSIENPFGLFPRLDAIIKAQIKRQIMDVPLQQQLNWSLCESSVRTSINSDLEVLKAEMRIQIHVHNVHHPRVVVEFIKTVTAKPVVIPINSNQHVHLQPTIVSLPARKRSLQWSNRCTMEAGLPNKWLDVNTLWECPMVYIKHSTLPWKLDGDGIIFYSSGVRLSNSDFQLRINIIEPNTVELKEIRVCLYTYIKIVELTREAQVNETHVNTPTHSNTINTIPSNLVYMYYIIMLYIHSISS